MKEARMKSDELKIMQWRKENEGGERKIKIRKREKKTVKLRKNGGKKRCQR